MHVEGCSEYFKKLCDLSSRFNSSLEVDFGKSSTLREGFFKPWHSNLILQTNLKFEDIGGMASLLLKQCQLLSVLSMDIHGGCDRML